MASASCRRRSFGAVSPIDLPSRPRSGLRIADYRYGAEGKALHDAIAARLMEARQLAAGAGQRRPGTAEYLDAVAASR